MLVLLSALGRHRSLTAKAEEKMSIVSTRRTNATDVETVDRFMLDELSGGKAPPLDIIRQRAQTVLADAGVVAVVASADDESVDIMVLKECMMIHAGDKFGKISELYVRPDRSSNGIALICLRSPCRKAALVDGRD